MRILLVAAVFGPIALSGCSREAASYSRFSSAEVMPTSPELKNTPATLPAEPRLEDYLSLAALRNPGLRAAWYRWQAERERAPQARGLPDPRITYSYFIREVETRVGPQRHKLGLSQTVPWPGKLVLAGQAAEAAATAEGKRYEAAKLALFHRVKQAYYDYHYLGRAIEITAANVELVRHLEAVARARYKAAAAEHPDVIRAQLELGKLEDRLKSLRELRGPVAAGLNALLDRSISAELPWPKESLTGSALSENDAELIADLKRANPDLAALAAEVARARKAVRLARHRYAPDFTLGVNWIATGEPDGPLPGEDRGKDPLALSVGISLPLWFGKHRAAGREARARLAAASLARRDRENLLLARVKKVLYEVRDAERKATLYGKTLLPKATEGLRSVEASFKVGKASFLDLVDAQRIRLEFQLALSRARTRHAQQVAALEMLIGRNVKLSPRGPKREAAGAKGENDERGK